MTWKPELEFCVQSYPFQVFFRGKDGYLHDFTPDDIVSKRFTIANNYLNYLLKYKPDKYNCYVDENNKWGYIANVMFRLIETDYKTCETLDDAQWLCEVIAYLEVE